MVANTLNEAVEPEIAKELLIEDETRLKNIAGFIFIAGAMLAIVIFSTTALYEVPGQLGTFVNWTGVVSSITTFLFSIGVWAFLRVVSNISITLKDMKKPENRQKE